LVISDADLIHSFFRLLEENSVDPATLLIPPTSKLVHEFFHSLAPLDKIFMSLSSKFSSPSEHKSTEEKVNRFFSRLSKAVEQHQTLAKG
jgi:hypothetical protein